MLNLVLEFVDVMARELSSIVKFLFKMGIENVFNVCLLVCLVVGFFVDCSPNTKNFL